MTIIEINYGSWPETKNGNIHLAFEIWRRNNKHCETVYMK